MKNKTAKIGSLSFVLMLVVSTFAFAFMIGSETSQVGAAQQSAYLPVGTNGQYETVTAEFTKGTGSSLDSAVYQGKTYVWNTLNDDSNSPSGKWIKIEAAAPVAAVAPVATGVPESGMFSNNMAKLIKDGGATWNSSAQAYDYKGKLYDRYGNEVSGSNAGDITLKTPFGDVKSGGLFPGSGYLLQGVAWAGIAAGIVQTVGGLFVDDKEELAAITAALAGGIMVGRGVVGGLFARGGAFSNWAGQSKYTSWLGTGAGQAVIGIAAAWLIYNSMWSKTETKTHIVTFDCLPWQAPHGGEDCELCNDNTLPCSEYRCKSLGQSCAIVNKGTIAERCVDVNPRDVSPPVITPLEDVITEGYQYFDVREMPPGAGFKIKSSRTETGCIPPFTPIKFGITTDEPSQCKIDIEPRGNYSKMSSYLGGDNLYSYNHTEYLTLPSAKDFKNSSVALKNGKELTFYMRCQDASGNSNEADYALTLCVDPSPDTTAPVVQGTSINNNGCIAATTENATVDFYINEPAQCRWSFTESSYDQMANNMLCANTPVDINALQSYTCRTTLNGIARDGTKFYVRCKDQPTNVVNDSARNVNRESYIFNLRGSSELKLKVLRPNETIFGVLNPSPIELYVETLFGCDNNKAICYYSTSDSAGSFVQFFDTNKADGVHTQRLDLTQGRYTYFVKCIDAGGNLVQNSTSFTVNIDTNSPIIARAYQEDNYLKIITHLNSECTYTNDNCDYLFDEGIVMPYPNSTSHVTEWSPSKKYYIKCRDEFRTEPADCSLVVGPTENFL